MQIMSTHWVSDVEQDSIGTADLDWFYINFVTIVIECASKSYERVSVEKTSVIIVIVALDSDVTTLPESWSPAIS